MATRIVIDRLALRAAVRDRLAALPALARLAVDEYAGGADEADAEAYRQRFLISDKGGIAVSYAGSAEDQTPQGRRKTSAVHLFYYAPDEATALEHLARMEADIDNRRLVTTPSDGFEVQGFDAFWSQDALIGEADGFFEYLVILRCRLV